MTDPIHETEDIFRLYRPEWVVVFTTDNEVEAAQHFEEKYAGRVREEDVQLAYSGVGAGVITQLQLRLPNLKGEFKYARLAAAFAAEQGWKDWDVVARNSKADHELRQYSIKKLPA